MGELHSREVIRIALMAGDDGVVRDHVFDGCHVKGPAVVLFDGCTVEHNTFRGPLDALLWEVDPEVRPGIIGAIHVQACTFTGCTFENVGIAGPAPVLAQFRAGT